MGLSPEGVVPEGGLAQWVAKPLEGSNGFSEAWVI
jgi:hypothetical protein